MFQVPPWLSRQYLPYMGRGRGIAMGKRKRASLADRMADRIRGLSEARQATIAHKLANGCRPRLDDNGNAVLVKVKGGPDGQG